MTITSAERKQIASSLLAFEAELYSRQALLQLIASGTDDLLAKSKALYGYVDSLYKSPWIGGDPGERGQIVVENQTITTPIAPGTRDVDYVNCVFDWAGIDEFILRGAYWNLRFLGCTIRNFKVTPKPNNTPKLFYVHNASDVAETDCGIVIQDLLLENCAADMFAEFKASGWSVVNVRYGANVSIPRQDVIFRHGLRGLVMNCPDFDYISVRGADALIDDCPKARVQLLAGNLPARRTEWENLYDPGGMNNQHTSADCFINAVRAVEVGPLMKEILPPKPGAPATLYPARGHCIDPAVPDASIKWVAPNYADIVRERRTPAWLADRFRGSVFA